MEYDALVQPLKDVASKAQEILGMEGLHSGGGQAVGIPHHMAHRLAGYAVRVVFPLPAVWLSASTV